MDVQRSWIDAGSLLAKVFLGSVIAVAALLSGVTTRDRPTVEDIDKAQERLDRLLAIELFVQALVPTDDNVPQTHDFFMATDPDQPIRLFSESSELADKLDLIVGEGVPLGQAAIDSGEANAFFLKRCGAGLLGNMLDGDQVNDYGNMFVAGINNISAINEKLKRSGILGKEAKDLTVRQLSTLYSLFRYRYYLIVRLAGEIRTQSLRISWDCGRAVSYIETASAWELDDPEGRVFEALDSDDSAITKIAIARPSALPGIRAELQEERADLVRRYVSEPTLQLTSYLPPTPFNSGIALLPCIITIALVGALAHLVILWRNLDRFEGTIAPGRWQHRLTNYLVFPLPAAAGGTAAETIIPTMSWIALMVLCIVARGLASDSLDRGTFVAEDYTGWGSWHWVHIDDLANAILDQVPNAYQYQTASVMLTYLAIATTGALLIVSARLRAKMNAMLRTAERDARKAAG